MSYCLDLDIGIFFQRTELAIPGTANKGIDMRMFFVQIAQFIRQLI